MRDPAADAGHGPAVVLAEFFGPVGNAESFRNTVKIQFQGLVRLAEFEPEEQRRDFQKRIGRIAGVTTKDDARTKHPSLSLTLLDSESAFAAFVLVMRGCPLSWADRCHPRRCKESDLERPLDTGIRPGEVLLGCLVPRIRSTPR